MSRWFNTFSELKQIIDEYIHYDNNEQIQTKLKGLSLVEYRTWTLPNFLGTNQNLTSFLIHLNCTLFVLL
ncbi:IS3 family transposase [Mannheimia granulomatis]|uniref:IS3 family transposase n=1 Tax=Mannheimia granulomatis TaxID=85402 RepID=UPI003AB9A684